MYIYTVFGVCAFVLTYLFSFGSKAICMYVCTHVCICICPCTLLYTYTCNLHLLFVLAPVNLLTVVFLLHIQLFNGHYQ